MNGCLKAYLVFGCNGLRHQNFLLCGGVSNKVLDLENMDKENYPKILDFLDNVCGLFDSPIFDHNKCSNILSLLYKDYLPQDQKTLNNIQAFIKTHKECGIYLMLILKEDYENERRKAKVVR